MAEKPTAILILGMHRSGTSAITRVLNLLGLQLPKQIMPPVEGNNESGFWESEQIADVHDRLLAEIGSAWDDCLRIPSAFSGSAVADRYAEEILTVLDRDFDRSSPFVIKDPRVCRLVPFWLDILEEFGANSHLVLIARHPLEVAASLGKRDFFPMGKSLHLWLRHLLDMERDSRPVNRSVITYAGLLTDWRQTVETIGSNMGSSWPRSLKDAAPEIEGFLSNSLRHHHTKETERKDQSRLSRWAHDVYGEFERAATGAQLPESALDEIAAQLDAAETVFGPTVAALQTSLANNRHEVEHRLQREHDLLSKTLLDSHQQASETYQAEIDKIRQAHLRDGRTYEAELARIRVDLQEAVEALQDLQQSSEARAADLERELRRDTDEKSWLWDRWQETKTQLEAPRNSKIGRLIWWQWTSYLAARRMLIPTGHELSQPSVSTQPADGHGPGSGIGQITASLRSATRVLSRPVTRGMGWTFLLFNSLWEQTRAMTRRALRGPGEGHSHHGVPPTNSIRPRVLLVSPYPIYPPHHGGGVRLFNLIQHLAKHCELHLLVFSHSQDNAEQRDVLSPWASSVSFHHWQPQYDPGWWNLQPPNSRLFYSHEAAQQIAHLVATLPIDILQLEYAELGQYGLPRFADVKVVLTEHDLAFRQHWRRRKMGFHNRFPEGNAFGATLGDWLRLLRYELAVCRRADQIHVMSDHDGHELSQYLKDSRDRIRVVPNAVDTAFYSPVEGATERSGVLYVGNFQNLPNVDALEYLIEEIWPQIRSQLPEIRLSVVGAHPSDRVTRFHGRDGIEVVGAVPDLRPYYHSHRLMVAPIRAGSGTRLKILEAFAAGLPVVSTSLGAEGIEAEHAEHLMLADEPRSFAEAVIELLQNEDLGDRLSGNALSLVDKSYDWQQSAEATLQGWNELLKLDRQAGSAGLEDR